MSQGLASWTPNLTGRVRFPSRPPVNGAIGRLKELKIPKSVGSTPTLRTMRMWWNRRHNALRTRRAQLIGGAIPLIRTSIY